MTAFSIIPPLLAAFAIIPENHSNHWESRLNTSRKTQESTITAIYPSPRVSRIIWSAVILTVLFPAMRRDAPHRIRGCKPTLHLARNRGFSPFLATSQPFSTLHTHSERAWALHDNISENETTVVKIKRNVKTPRFSGRNTGKRLLS